MSWVSEYQNLCVTCEGAPSCTFIKDPNRTVFVLDCEEYEGYIDPSMKNTFLNIPQLSIAPSRSIAMENSVFYMGLCRNCENRKTCSFPKPEGGVWECEEYL